jgi:hypothetical protein
VPIDGVSGCATEDSHQRSPQFCSDAAEREPDHACRPMVPVLTAFPVSATFVKKYRFTDTGA